VQDRKFGGSHLDNDLKLRSVELFDKVVEIQMLDSGYENFKETKASCYLQAHACLICYDITDLSSFQSVKKWEKQIQKYNSNVVTMLVGTKSDMSSKRSVTAEAGQNLASAMGIPFIETSSKTDVNVDECFVNCARRVFNVLAWPTYIPPEKIFRSIVGLPEVDWCVKGEVDTKPKCTIQ